MRFWSDEDGVRRYYPLHQGRTLIGRHPSCDIVLPGRHVSKHHLECHVEDAVVSVRDLGSSNGTTVNGQSTTSCVLNHGDEISLGGYRLVLDAEAGTAPAPAPEGRPEAAPASEPELDIEPIGGAPTAPEDTEGRLAAELVEPVEGEPEGDETPVDGAFVPQAYAPESLQPQVVSREGRMYLRDPRTNREVEIVPRRAGPSADLSGYYEERAAEEKKKNLYLIGACIAVGLLLIVALVWSTSEPDDKPPPPAKKFSLAVYNTKVEKSIDLMKAGRFDEAMTELKIAHEEYTPQQVAGTLLEIAEKWKKSGQPAEEFNWLSVETALRSLVDNRWSTAKVRSFATDRIDHIYDIKHQQDIADEALRLLSQGKPEEAKQQFDKLPPDSAVRRKHAQDIAEAVRACFDMHMRRAREARSRGEWEAALQHYQAAEPYASDLEKTDVAKGRRDVRKRMKEEQVLNRANLRLREDTPASLRSARSLLDQIEPDSPLATRRDDLRNRIETRLAELRLEQKAAEARAHYQAGRGQQAAALITEHHLTALYPLRTKIQTLERLLKEAQAAYEVGDYDKAKARWLDVTHEETSPNNAYHKRAVAKLAELNDRDRRKEIALEYNRRADAALADGDPRSARKLYLKAMKWDPLATIGKDGLDSLDHLARVTYVRARDLRNKGGLDNLKQALTLFKKVREYVEEGNKYHNWATRQINETQAELDQLREKTQE
jgi:hypothetical protein